MDNFSCQVERPWDGGSKGSFLVSLENSTAANKQTNHPSFFSQMVLTGRLFSNDINLDGPGPRLVASGHGLNLVFQIHPKSWPPRKVNMVFFYLHLRGPPWPA